MTVKKSFLTLSVTSLLSHCVYRVGCGQSVMVAFVPNSLKGVVFLLGCTLMAGDSLGPDHESMTFGKSLFGIT